MSFTILALQNIFYQKQQINHHYEQTFKCQRTGHLSRTVYGRSGSFQLFGHYLPMGCGSWLYRHPNSSWDGRLIDLPTAATSQTYCDDLIGKVAAHGLQITELSTHLQGQLVAVNPAYDELFDAFAPDEVKGNPKARTAWAVKTLKQAAHASKNLGLNAHATFSGAPIWHTVYPGHSDPKV